MNTVVFLIRHGEYLQSFDKSGRRLTPFPETPLSAKGKEQMIHLAKKIGGLDILISSPYRRTRESAKILEKELSVSQFVVDEQLRDVWTPGWWGTPIEDLKSIGGDVYSVVPKSPDQETLAHLIERSYGALRNIVTSNEGKKIGIVSHGDPIRVLLDRLEYPKRGIPDMRSLAKMDYLGYAEAWKLQISHDLTVENRDLIGRHPEIFGKGGRIY